MFLDLFSEAVARSSIVYIRREGGVVHLIRADRKLLPGIAATDANF
jgi:D-aminopeptidase, domain B.